MGKKTAGLRSLTSQKEGTILLCISLREPFVPSELEKESTRLPKVLL